MAAKSTTGQTDIDRAREMFASAKDRFAEMTVTHSALCASLAATKRLLTDHQEEMFLYEAQEETLQHIPGGQNERERKYALATWKDGDPNYIQFAQRARDAELTVERLTREVELVRFRISAVKRSMEFAIAWMHAIAGAA